MQYGKQLCSGRSCVLRQ